MNTPGRLSGLAHERWDVVVIGAGPAGGAAAAALASAGGRTLIVDRKAFPRTKVCGGCLNGRALGALAAIGLRLPRDAPWCGETLDTLEYRARGRTARLPLPGGVAVDRAGFDAWLIGEAEARGATFCSGVLATVGEVAGDGRQVHLHSSEGNADERAVVTGRMILAADGLGGGSWNAEGASRRIAPASYLGAGAVIDHLDWDLPPGAVAMNVGGQGYVGVAPIGTGRSSVAAALAPACVRQYGGIGPALLSILAESAGAEIAARVADDLLAAPWQGTPLLSTRRGQVAAERLFVLGDAAGYVEPFTGEGMAWAIEGAVAAAPLVGQGVREWRAELAVAWTRRHAQIVRRGWCHSLSWLLRKPWFVQTAIRVLEMAPWLVRPAVHGIHVSHPYAESAP